MIAEDVTIKLDPEPPYTLLTWKELDEYLARNRYTELKGSKEYFYKLKQSVFD